MRALMLGNDVDCRSVGASAHAVRPDMFLPIVWFHCMVADGDNVSSHRAALRFCVCVLMLARLFANDLEVHKKHHQILITHRFYGLSQTDYPCFQSSIVRVTSIATHNCYCLTRSTTGPLTRLRGRFHLLCFVGGPEMAT